MKLPIVYVAVRAGRPKLSQIPIARQIVIPTFDRRSNGGVSLRYKNIKGKIARDLPTAVCNPLIIELSQQFGLSAPQFGMNSIMQLTFQVLGMKVMNKFKQLNKHKAIIIWVQIIFVVDNLITLDARALDSTLFLLIDLNIGNTFQPL